MIFRVLVAMVVLFFTLPARASCWDTGYDGMYVGLEDCDEDGWRKMDGDCDDYDAGINPGREESCDETKDENCDGFFNEGCEREVERGSLLGGQCATGGVASLGASGVFVLWAGLFLRRARR